MKFNLNNQKNKNKKKNNEKKIKNYQLDIFISNV